jgi:N-acetyl-anhydromuramyl-L-alanine amidase AmpD
MTDQRIFEQASYDLFPELEVKGERILPKVVWRGTVACHSVRPAGAKIELLVIHDTEGANIPHSARDLFGLRDFFDHLSTQASANVGVDGDGQSIQMVPDSLKAWHVAFFNPWSLGLELVHKQGETYTDAQYDEAARWFAWWCRKHKVPNRAGAVTKDGRITRSGIVRHAYLGNLGGGHHDPIPPWNERRFRQRVAHFYKLQQAHHHI